MTEALIRLAVSIARGTVLAGWFLMLLCGIVGHWFGLPVLASLGYWEAVGIAYLTHLLVGTYRALPPMKTTTETANA